MMCIWSICPNTFEKDCIRTNYRTIMFVITLQSWLFWLLFVRSLDRAYGDEMTKGESGSPSNVSTRFDTGVVFFKSTFHQDHRVVNGIFQTTMMTSLMDCLFLCANKILCDAINYREDFSAENCELIELIDGETGELVKDVGYKFYLLMQDNLKTVDTQQFCDQVCSEPKKLGMENGLISDSQISASSEYSPNHSSSNSRLFYTPHNSRTGAWSSKTDDINQWLQIDFKRTTAIVGISTQGRAGTTYTQFVKSYTLSYNQDGLSFQAYKPHGILKVIDGNIDTDSVVYHSLPTAITTRYVRVHPKTWHGHISMRVEFHGCYKDCDGTKDLGMRSGKILNSQITASSEWDSNHGPNNARLFFIAHSGRKSAWSSKSNDLNQWLKVDFKRQTVVVGISTQGREDCCSQWVKTYTLHYSIDGVTFFLYKHDGQAKVFNGNGDKHSAVHNVISPAIDARYVRIEPKSWNEHISLRVEFYGF